MAATDAAGDTSGGSTGGQRMAANREMEMEILRRHLEFCVRVSGASQEGDHSNKSMVDQMIESSMDFSASVKISIIFMTVSIIQLKFFMNIKNSHVLSFTSCLLRTIHNHPRRCVALKLMYFGQRFYGFASEAQQEPTVESEIFKALGKTKLSTGNRADLCYSRCGRTDKGVSSTGQDDVIYHHPVDFRVFILTSPKKYPVQEEIDYVRVLNRALPNDIRVIGWSAASTHFNASIFWRGSLNVMEMKYAAKKFIGIHDFRNFCKMDAVNVKNYTRQIISFEINPCYERSGGDELWAMTIKGSAFLWHQVRFMVAVLFMIGEGHESPCVLLTSIEKMNIYLDNLVFFGRSENKKLNWIR
ncbi:unnamed protein product [Spirodela intermedia]|uniref:tRNA pseudouridine synthase n=1 Tax=Spirodela intermedia TaxID=51605 RepID=A0A7I8IPN1_SPIIN|nr:unnamed protein product [Spirodela intermedia]CAA6659534.1 unnamed protein product [Spirodela intermedia]